MTNPGNDIPVGASLVRMFLSKTAVVWEYSGTHHLYNDCRFTCFLCGSKHLYWHDYCKSCYEHHIKTDITTSHHFK